MRLREGRASRVLPAAVRMARVTIRVRVRVRRCAWLGLRLGLWLGLANPNPNPNPHRSPTQVRMGPRLSVSGASCGAGVSLVLTERKGRGSGGEGGAGGAGGEGGEGGEVYSEVYIWGGDRCSVGAQLPVAISPYISVYLPGSPYLRISPYISAYLPISPHISLYLRISPYTSAYFRIPPHISLYLRISPRISQARSSPWRSWRVAACSARAPRSRGAC